MSEVARIILSIFHEFICIRASHVVRVEMLDFVVSGPCSVADCLSCIRASFCGNQPCAHADILVVEGWSADVVGHAAVKSSGKETISTC